MPEKNAELSVVAVDKDGSLPLYAQVEQDLKRLMDTGYFSEGALLPPEHDLCRLYGVSRHTIRMALSRLEAAGMVERSAGRGTFVKPQENPATFYLDRSFTHQMADMGLQAHTEVLNKQIKVDRFELARLRFGGEEPIAIQHAVIYTARCPGIHHFDWVTCSLYEVLAQHYRLAVTEIEHTIGVALADVEQAHLLNAAEGHPLLRVETAAFLADRELIEHTTSYYRGDQYLYRTVHTL